jgi:hypothetical protein
MHLIILCAAFSYACDVWFTAQDDSIGTLNLLRQNFIAVQVGNYPTDSTVFPVSNCSIGAMVKFKDFAQR